MKNMKDKINHKKRISLFNMFKNSLKKTLLYYRTTEIHYRWLENPEMYRNKIIKNKVVYI